MFSCETKLLIATLSKVTGVVDKSSIQPILSNVLLELKDDVLSIMAADSQIHAVARIRVKPSKSTTKVTCVNANKLLLILTNTDVAELVFKVENNNLRIRPAKSSTEKGFKLSVFPAEQFPRPSNTAKPTKILKLPKINLLQALTRLQPTVSTEMHRQYLTGVFFDFQDNQVVLVATDGHRMALDKLVCDQTGAKNDSKEKTEGLLVPRKAINQLVTLLNDDDETPVIMEPLIDNERLGTVRFEMPGVMMTTALIDAVFPPYERVIPKDNDKEVVFNRSELADILTQVATIQDKKGDAVSIQITKNSTVIRAEGTNSGDEAQLDVATEYAGETLNVNFNCTYLTDMVKAFEGQEKITLAFKESTTSMLCQTTKKNASALKYVVMPVNR